MREAKLVPSVAFDESALDALIAPGYRATGMGFMTAEQAGITFMIDAVLYGPCARPCRGDSRPWADEHARGTRCPIAPPV